MIDRFFRMLPVFKGKQRLCRLALGDLSSRRDILIMGKYGCVYRIPNIQENVGFEIFINGIYEEENINFIVQKLGRYSKGTFLDVGANIGSIAIPVLKRCQNMQATCIEAAPWVFQYLDKNIKANNFKDVILLNKAVSSKSGDKVMFYSPLEKYGKGSMAPVFTSDGVEVTTICLDDLDDGQVRMLKIDVEGFEQEVFKGGKGLLSKDDAPDILFEFVDWAEQTAYGKTGLAQELLMEYNYQIHYVAKGLLGTKISTPVTSGSYTLFATKHR